MTDFTRLSTDWTTWSTWLGMSNVSVSIENKYAWFKSDDDTVCLRKEQGWWVIDSINDRGERLNDIGRFSNFELAEKYLVAQWAFSVTNARELGPDLYVRGMNPDVTVHPTDNEWRVELDSSAGKARLSTPEATIFGYLLFTPTNHIEQRVNQALTRKN